VLFLSSCTKFSKNSNVSMAPRSRDERTSHTQESEKSTMIATLVKSAENPICFQPTQRWWKLWTCSKKGSKPWLHTKHATDFMEKIYIHEHRMQPDDAWASETWFVYLTKKHIHREKGSANSAKTDDLRKPIKSTDV
jgi:hypothetical protein